MKHQPLQASRRIQWPPIPMQAAKLSGAEPGVAREEGKEGGSRNRDHSLGIPVPATGSMVAWSIL